LELLLESVPCLEDKEKAILKSVADVECKHDFAKAVMDANWSTHCKLDHLKARVTFDSLQLFLIFNCFLKNEEYAIKNVQNKPELIKERREAIHGLGIEEVNAFKSLTLKKDSLA
jgi:hypothetical protein